MSSDAFEAITLERILTKENLTQALRKVEANKGSPGVEHPGELSSAIRTGTYRPSPIRRVYIPKDNGEKRHNYWNKSISYEMHRALKVEVLWSEGWYDLGRAMREVRTSS